MRRFEDELGFTVSERSSHHVALNAAGTAMLAPAKALLRAAAAAELFVASAQRLAAAGALAAA